jgi:SAM-dependent methyltransferase
LNQAPLCKICSAKTTLVGTKKGNINTQLFYLFRCPACHFAFVQNPDTNYAEIYSEKYYRGQGADTSIDYVYELENFDTTIRLYEWRGILKIINSIISIDKNTQWLDFGCGNGGLVRYCQQNSPAQIVGYEDGWIKQKAELSGIQILNQDDLASHKQKFDIITAIEVLEHVENPDQTLKMIRSLLKPNGLFFYTTGNAQPFRQRLLKWGYFAPEVHISLYEPKSLEFALQAAGFNYEYKNLLAAGFNDLIRYKILKKFKMRDRNWKENLLPWSLIARFVDKMHQISAHPIAWATKHSHSVSDNLIQQKSFSEIQSQEDTNAFS